MAIAERLLHIRPLAEMRSDKALVQAAQKGQKAAAEALVERHYPRVLSFLTYQTGKRSAAEDLAQEVFVRALGALHRFNGRYRFEPWLLRIARNLVIDESRRGVHRPEPIDPTELPSLENLQTSEDRVWERVAIQLATSSVHAALAKLPARQRAILILREIEGMSYGDIAQVVGTNERGVEGTLRRARARFRLEMAAAETEEGSRAVCRRMMRLVAEAGDTGFKLEAKVHLGKCEECRRRAASVHNADKVFSVLPPLVIGGGNWIGDLASAAVPKKVAAPRRGVLESLRLSSTTSAPLAHALQAAASLFVAAAVSLGGLATGTRVASVSASASSPLPEILTPDSERPASALATAARPLGPGTVTTSSSPSETAAPEDERTLWLLSDGSLVEINLIGLEIALSDMLGLDVDAAGLLGLDLDSLGDQLSLEEALVDSLDGLGFEIVDQSAVQDTPTTPEPEIPEPLPGLSQTPTPAAFLPRRFF